MRVVIAYVAEWVHECPIHTAIKRLEVADDRIAKG